MNLGWLPFGACIVSKWKIKSNFFFFMAVDITIKCRSFKKRLNKRYEFIILIYESYKHCNICRLYHLLIPNIIKIISSRKNEKFQRYRIGKNLTFLSLKYLLMMDLSTIKFCLHFKELIRV